MRVVLLRHGVAVDRDERGGPADPDRPLTADGRARTRAAVEGLRALGVCPEAVLTSPYLRAVQTAEIVCAALGVEGPETCKSLRPDADPAELARHLAGRSEAEILCAGHEPHLGLMLTYLVQAREVTDAFTGLKKAGAACVDVEHPGRTPGDLLWLLPPRILRRLGGAK